MHKFPDGIQTVLQAIIHCAKQNDVKMFLRGDLVLYALTGSHDFIQGQKIDLILSYDQSFDTHKLYQCMIQHVIVNKEIENSSKRYHIISAGYGIKIDLIHQFDPTRLTQAKRYGSFNLDLLFLNESGKLRHPPEISADPSFLKNIHDKSQWSFEDVLGFIIWSGTIPNLNIDEDQYGHLRLSSLGMIKESLDITWEEQIEKILLLRRSGAALKFISKTFADGMSWTFKVLIDYMIYMNVGINEESNIETVFSDKKLELVDLYNDFFLGDKQVAETADNIHHRLTTVLKLLFDSPNLSIPRPYINTIQAMAGGALGRCCLGSDVGSTIAFFGCGDNIDELDCALPVDCTMGSTECLREHPAFSHISDILWNSIVVDRREWCPDQVCPAADNMHCLQPISSSSSSTVIIPTPVISSSSSSVVFPNSLQQIVTGSGDFPNGLAELHIDILLDGGTPVDVTKAFVMMEFFGPDGSIVHNEAFRNYQLIDSTTIRCDGRNLPATNLGYNYEYTLVEFDAYSDMFVQQTYVNVSFSEGYGEVTVTIPMDSVTLDESMILYSGHAHNGTDSSDVGSQEAYRIEFEDSYNWNLTSEDWFDADIEAHNVFIIDWNDPETKAQQGTFVVTAGSSYATETPPIAVDRERTALFITYTRDGSDTSSVPVSQNMFAATLNTSGDIEIFLYDGAENDITIAWQLVEFPAGFVRVQHYLEEVLAGTAYESIGATSSFDQSRSFVTGTVGTWWGWGWGALDDTSGDVFNASFSVHLRDSSSSVSLERAAISSDLTAGFQIIEFLP